MSSTPGRGLDDSLLYVQSIGGEVEIGNMGDGGSSQTGNLTDDDIYGDLDTLVFSSAAKVKPVSREVLETHLSNARKEVSELKERISELSKENRNLLSNFSSLLKTAREDKEKNIFTLRELRNQLRHVTNLNAQHSSLSKEEILKIQTYCNQVEDQLQSQISLQVIGQALEAAKQKHIETKTAAYKKKWSKQIKLDNMSIYLCREQIPFVRSEPVTFPKPSRSVEIPKTLKQLSVTSKGPEKPKNKPDSEHPCSSKTKSGTNNNGAAFVGKESESKPGSSEKGARLKGNPRRNPTELQTGYEDKSYGVRNNDSKKYRPGKEETSITRPAPSHYDGARRQQLSSISSARENSDRSGSTRYSDRLDHSRKKSRSPSKDDPPASRNSAKRSRTRSRSSSPYHNGRTRHSVSSNSRNRRRR